MMSAASAENEVVHGGLAVRPAVERDVNRSPGKVELDERRHHRDGDPQRGQRCQQTQDHRQAAREFRQESHALPNRRNAERVTPMKRPAVHEFLVAVQSSVPAHRPRESPAIRTATRPVKKGP